MNGFYAYDDCLCKGDAHFFLYTSTSTNDRVLEGAPCMCGKMKAHYTSCPTCGQDMLTLVERGK
jgi:hypothetical protein